VADNARRTLTHIPHNLITGFSTDPLISTAAKHMLPTTGAHIAISEILGGILSSEAYPEILHKAIQTGLIGKETLVAPQYGATLWRPSDILTFVSPPGTTVYWGERILYSSRHSTAQNLAEGWEVFEKFLLTPSPDTVATQRTQTNTSTHTVSSTGTLNSITLAIWARIGDRGPAPKHSRRTRSSRGPPPMDYPPPTLTPG
jgi:hypothetical protein